MFLKNDLYSCENYRQVTYFDKSILTLPQTHIASDAVIFPGNPRPSEIDVNVLHAMYTSRLNGCAERGLETRAVAQIAARLSAGSLFRNIKMSKTMDYFWT